MDTWMMLVAGVVLLIIGGEVLVRGASTAAARLGVSPLMIGLTLVGFGTSAPELVTSVRAALVDSPGIAVGNVVGSNIANVLLILGLTALVAPIEVDPRAFRRDGTALALATGVCVAVAVHGVLDRTLGLALLAGLLAYIVVTYFQERVMPDLEGERIEGAAEAKAAPRLPVWPSLLLAAVGIGLTVGGAKFLVDGAIVLARNSGVSESLIGLTVVAVGTSLPELATSVMAAVRGRSEIALGNIVGSNLYNILAILGTTAVIKPIAVPEAIAHIDVWIMAGVTALLLVFARTHYRITRAEGLNLVLIYVAYMLVLQLRATGLADVDLPFV